MYVKNIPTDHNKLKNLINNDLDEDLLHFFRE